MYVYIHLRVCTHTYIYTHTPKNCTGQIDRVVLHLEQGPCFSCTAGCTTTWNKNISHLLLQLDVTL